MSSHTVSSLPICIPDRSEGGLAPNHLTTGTVQSVIRTVLGFYRRGTSRDTKAQSFRGNILQQQLTYIGDLLLDALRLQRELGRIDLNQAAPENLEAWRECRATVEQLTIDYASLVGKWREAITCAGADSRP
jgi:hypothetical protein